ncbi:MAG: hypothetical protein PHG97_01955 [Candidatus Margulisbacteria bacterium]|nr:hypothetical protein [Candidatus Margulisiibacteriota bacterium]
MKSFAIRSSTLRLAAVLGLSALSCFRSTPPKAPHLISVQGGNAATLFIGEATQKYYLHALTPNSGVNLILYAGKMPSGANTLMVRLRGTINEYDQNKEKLEIAVGVRNWQNDQKTLGFFSIPTNSGSSLFIDRQINFSRSELPAGADLIKITAPGPFGCSLTVEVSYSYRP